MTNFLTFDIEEWFHANYSSVQSPAPVEETNLESLVDRLIALCAERSVRTTCFVVASVAQAKPAIVRKLHSSGHEIASHGCGHQLVYSMGRERFAGDLRKSIEILQGITGDRVLGFRAPSFSVTREILPWFYDTLEDAGLRYSSSVFPGRTFLYGVPGFPDRVHRPILEGRQRRIVEFPIPAVRCAGREIGLYVRLFPAWAIVRRIAKDNSAGKPVILYVHPREIDPDQPRLTLPFLHSLIHYWGVRSCEAKLRSIIGSAPFGRIGDYLDALHAFQDP